MDWNIFWSAFGAIGTTLGSMVTAIAVIIAVKQYKQPLKKIIQVKMSCAFSSDMYSGKPLDFYCISIKNRGIRPVEINSICIRGNKKNLWINNMEFISNARIGLPIKIDAEQNKDYLFEVNNFKNGIREAVEKKILSKRNKLIIFVTDSLGDEYVCKTNIRVGGLIK